MEPNLFLRRFGLLLLLAFFYSFMLQAKADTLSRYSGLWKVADVDAAVAGMVVNSNRLIIKSNEARYARERMANLRIRADFEKKTMMCEDENGNPIMKGLHGKFTVIARDADSFTMKFDGTSTPTIWRIAGPDRAVWIENNKTVMTLERVSGK